MNIMKQYRVSFSTPYTWWVMVIIPICVIGAIIFGAVNDFSEILLCGVAFVITVTDLIGDFLSLNGMLTAQIGFGCIRNSSKGREYVKNTVIVDQIRRFVYIAILMMAGALIYSNTTFVKEAFSDKSLFYQGVIFTILVMYVTDTLILNVVRYITMFMPYFMVASIAVLINTVLFAVIEMIAAIGVQGIIPWIILMAVLAILSTWATEYHVVCKYEESFY